MDCHHAKKWFAKYADNELTAARMAEMDAHIAACANCQAECARLRSTLGRIQDRFEVLPNLKASPDFDLRVLDRVLPQIAQPESFFDRLDAIFARPLYKLLGSTALGLFLATLIVAAVLLPQSLGGSTSMLPGTTESTAPVREAQSPDGFYATHGLLSNAAYADIMRDLYPVEATPPRRRQSGRRESSWDAATSESSYLLLSGSLC